MVINIILYIKSARRHILYLNVLHTALLLGLFPVGGSAGGGLRQCAALVP